MTLSDAQRDKKILLEKIWKITFSEETEWNTSWKSQGDVFVCEKNNNNKKNHTNKQNKIKQGENWLARKTKSNKRKNSARILVN